MRLLFRNRGEMLLTSIGVMLLLWSAIGYLAINVGSYLNGWTLLRTNEVGEGFPELVLSLVPVIFGSWLLLSLARWPTVPVIKDPKCKDLSVYDMMVLAILRESQRSIRADTLARVLHKARHPTEEETNKVEKALGRLLDEGLVSRGDGLKSKRYVATEGA